MDHSFMSFINYYEQESDPEDFKVIGLDHHIPLSKHSLAARRLKAQTVVQ